MRNPQRILLDSAANGLQVWLIYAVVEYVFASAVPMLLHREKFLGEGAWFGTVLLFICFGVWGILMGFLAGLSMIGATELPPAEFDRRCRKLLILLMVVAYAINLAFLPDQPGRVTELLTIPLVAAAVIFNLGKTQSNSGLSDAPAVVAGTLIVSSRLAMVRWSSVPAARAIPLMLLVTSVLLLASVLAIRVVSRVRSSRRWSPALEGAVIVVMALVLVFGPGAVSSIDAQTVSAAPPERRVLPNVILITMDTVRADHMGIYGYARQNTPNLQELLNDSTLYTEFIAASTLTLTSHASIFTGLYPRSHGAYKQFPDNPHGVPLSNGMATMASMLTSAGYQSMAVAANTWYLVPQWGLMQGFEYSVTPVPVRLTDLTQPYLLRSHFRDVLEDKPMAKGLFNTADTLHADGINRRAYLLLDRVSRKAPFFLFLNYMDAHWPYNAPPSFDRYPGRDDRFSIDDQDEAAMRSHIDCDGQPIPHGYVDHVVSQYDGGIGFIDQKIGELVQYLKKNGMYENTMIIVTSDHGEALGSRGSVGHNVSVYEDQIHIPLIVKYPGNRGAGRVTDIAGHVDILPTVLDVVGLRSKTQLPGVSLLRLNSAPNRTVTSERHYGPTDVPTPRFPEVQYALYQGTLKLISSSSGGRELYDLAKDPLETTNLLTAGTAVPLESVLLDWIRHTPRPSVRQQAVDAPEMKRLRSLGYVQ